MPATCLTEPRRCHLALILSYGRIPAFEPVLTI